IMVMPAALPRQTRAATQQRELLDFRPVFRNRAAMGWIAGYTVHIWEWAALRAWGVTFLTVVIAQSGAPPWLPDPALLFALVKLVGIALSIPGNETAQRPGRMRVVSITMSTAAALSLLAGWA